MVLANECPCEAGAILTGDIVGGVVVGVDVRAPEVVEGQDDVVHASVGRGVPLEVAVQPVHPHLRIYNNICHKYEK